MTTLKNIVFLLAALLMIQPLLAQSEVTEPRVKGGSSLQIAFKNIPTEDVSSVSGAYHVNRGDGTISLPYLKNRVKVSGLTVRDIENSIRNQYVSQKIYSDPIVQVTLASNNEIGVDARFVHVTGFVGAKKNLPYREGITLIEALIDCGDITDFGSRKIQVSRGGVTRTYDYFSARDRSIRLQPEDTIYVPRRSAWETRPSNIGP